jgi:hypothetical protein
MTAALTLADYANNPSPLVAGVAKVLRENSPFMDKLPFENVAALSVEVNREGNMSDVAWRNIGESHGSVLHTKPDKVTENVFSIGNEIIVDKMYLRDKSARLYNPMTYQTKMTTKSIARNFTDKIVNGLPSDKKNPVGLFYRLKNDLGASQNLLAKSGGLDISDDASGLSANIQAFIDKLDQLLYAVTDDFSLGGNGVLLLCNDTMLMRINSAFRQSGALDESKDALGRIFLTYKGATFIDMGLKYDESTRIIANAELADGTALTGGGSTSIYAVKLGKEYFTGWQEYALEVSEPTLMDDQVTYKSVVDWPVGIAVSHPRSIARLYGVIAA